MKHPNNTRVFTRDDIAMTIIGGISCEELCTHVAELVCEVAEFCRDNTPFSGRPSHDFTQDAETTIDLNTTQLFEAIRSNTADLGEVYDYAFSFAASFLGDTGHHSIDLVAEYVAMKVMASGSMADKEV